jgi:hypothetical protein
LSNAFISHFNTQTMHIKSFYTQQHCYVSQKTLHPGGIRTRVFLFLSRMRCPLRHAARAEQKYFHISNIVPRLYCKRFALWNFDLLNVSFSL